MSLAIQMQAYKYLLLALLISTAFVYEAYANAFTIIEDASQGDQSWNNLPPIGNNLPPIDRDSGIIESGTRSFHVRNQELSEGIFHHFHPFHSVPSSPEQDSLYLTDEMPLVAVLPDLGSGPTYSSLFSTFEISYQIEDFVIKINAIRDYFDPLGGGDAVLGQSEYLLPLGILPAGTYQTVLNYTKTGLLDTAISVPSSIEVEQEATLPSFTVYTVPEPATGFLLSISLLTITQRRLIPTTPHSA